MTTEQGQGKAEDEGRAHTNDEGRAQKTDDPNTKQTQSQNDDDTGGGATETVPKADLDRALMDLKKFKNNFRDSTKKLQELEARFEEKEREALEKNKDFESLYQKEKEMRVKAQADLKETTGKFIHTQKHSKVKDALVQAGFDPGALNILDSISLEDVQVDVAHNKFVVEGADTFVESMKEQYPYLFRKKGIKINGGGAGSGQKHGDPEELTAAFMSELKKTDRAKYKQLFPKFAKQAQERQNARS